MKSLTIAILLGSFFFCAYNAAADSESPKKTKKVALPIPDILPDPGGEGDFELPNLEEMNYRELENSRQARLLLIKYLVEEGKIRESPKGTIDFLSQLNSTGRRAVLEENHTRKAMFELIAKREKRAFASVGREFHKKLTEKASAKPKKEEEIPDLEPVLVIQAPYSLRQSFLPDFVSGYLESLSYGNPQSLVQPNGNTRIVGRRSFGSGFLAVDVANISRRSSSTTAVQQKYRNAVEFNVGGTAGAAPPNTLAIESLAIVVHPDNPVASLSVAQIADIFAGKIKTWNKIRGGTDDEILTLIPQKRPGLIEQFREMVLEPQEEYLPAKKFVPEDGDEPDTKKQKPQGDFLKQLVENPHAIAYCLPSEITKKMKGMPIKASSESLALAPSSINIQSLDYPLVRFVSVKTLGTPTGFITEFIDYTKRESKTGSLAASGFTEIDRYQAQDHRDYLLEQASVPSVYKSLVKNKVRLHSPANFRFASSSDDFKLTNYSQNNLNRLVALLQQDEHKGKEVVLIGFADSYGRASANLTYSEKRAIAIADLLKEQGITNVKTAGVGEEMPIADNDKESGRSANQRVEVWLEE